MLCERYTKGAALLHSLANNMIADMGDIRGTIYETLFCMYGPDGASGPYMLVIPERCIP